MVVAWLGLFLWSCSPTSEENGAPTVEDQVFTTEQNATVDIELVAEDPDGDPLTWEIVTDPTIGVLWGDAPLLSYVPDPGLSGTDSFTFRVSDGVATSSAALATVEISPLDIPSPQAIAQDVETDEDVAVDITLTGSSSLEGSLIYSIVVQPDHGQLTGTAPHLSYTPDSDVHGEDLFTFRVADANSSSTTAEVRITILPVNDAPVAYDGVATTLEDMPVDIVLEFEDIDSESLFAVVDQAPRNGQITGAAPVVTYLPTLNYFGDDEIWYTVNDGELTSKTAVILLTVTGTPDAPIATEMLVTTQEDVPLEFELDIEDPDDDPVQAHIEIPPAHGLVSIQGVMALYTPSANWSGVDTFVVWGDDGMFQSASVPMMVQVYAVNDAPSAPVVSISPPSPTEEDNLLCQIDTPAADLEGDPLVYTFAWTIDGVEFPGPDTAAVVVSPAMTHWAGDTIPAEATALQQEWKCRVRADDGNLQGPIVESPPVVIGTL